MQLTTEERIVQELQKGDRFYYDLRKVLNLGYREFWSAIYSLKMKGDIICYFRSTAPSATMAFTIPEHQALPMAARWNRPKPEPIKTWKPLLDSYAA